jgi:hypothetical protein
MNRKSIEKWAGRALVAGLVMLLAVGFAYSLPMDLAFLAVVDVATYVDALVGVYVVANLARIRPMIAHLRATAIGIARRTRSHSSHMARRPLPKRADNDDDHPALAVAA